jgi:TorA maturation chaperone TorD
MINCTTTNVDWLDTLTGQTLFFGVLAKLIYVYPEKKWIESLITEDIFAEVPFANDQADVIDGVNLMQSWCNAHRGELSMEEFDNLRADFTRLFLGPAQAPAAPWESVYFCDERLVFQQQTLQVREWYARFGLELVHLHQEPDDHIGLELEFLAHLAKLGVQALEANDSARFDELLKAQREFLAAHPIKWGMEWCRLVEKNAQTDFYRAVASLTRGSLAELATMLQVPIPQLVELPE